MASLEQRGNRYRVAFRLGGVKQHVGIKAANRQEAESFLARIEENLRLVERGRLVVPEGADLDIYLLTDGRLDRKVAVVRVLRLSELFEKYRTTFTLGAKEKITRKIVVEHAIGKRKVWRVAAERRRNPRRRHTLMMKNVAGLHNRMFAE